LSETTAHKNQVEIEHNDKKKAKSIRYKPKEVWLIQHFKISREHASGFCEQQPLQPYCLDQAV
jgi:hypothetical protein